MSFKKIVSLLMFAYLSTLANPDSRFGLDFSLTSNEHGILPAMYSKKTVTSSDGKKMGGDYGSNFAFSLNPYLSLEVGKNVHLEPFISYQYNYVENNYESSGRNDYSRKETYHTFGFGVGSNYRFLNNKRLTLSTGPKLGLYFHGEPTVSHLDKRGDWDDDDDLFDDYSYVEIGLEMPLYMNFDVNKYFGLRVAFQAFTLNLHKESIEYEKTSSHNGNEVESTQLEADFLGFSEPTIGFYWNL